MSTGHTAARWLGLSAGLGALGVLMLLLVLCCGAAPLNQLTLWKLWWAYEALPHPPDSTALRTYFAVGLLEGNGNHCDFIAGEQRRSALSAEELRAFYADFPELHLYFPAPIASDDAYVSYVTASWPEGSYAVYLFDWGTNDDFDVRCY